jgi:hypothetical protein
MGSTLGALPAPRRSGRGHAPQRLDGLAVAWFSTSTAANVGAAGRQAHPAGEHAPHVARWLCCIGRVFLASMVWARCEGAALQVRCAAVPSLPMRRCTGFWPVAVAKVWLNMFLWSGVPPSSDHRAGVVGHPCVACGVFRGPICRASDACVMPRRRVVGGWAAPFWRDR